MPLNYKFPTGKRSLKLLCLLSEDLAVQDSKHTKRGSLGHSGMMFLNKTNMCSKTSNNNPTTAKTRRGEVLASGEAWRVVNGYLIRMPWQVTRALPKRNQVRVSNGLNMFELMTHAAARRAIAQPGWPFVP